MFDFAQSFSQLRLNDTEMGLFTGVVLATAGKTSIFIIIGINALISFTNKLCKIEIKLKIVKGEMNRPFINPHVVNIVDTFTVRR